MAVLTQAKFDFNRLMVTLIFGIRASEPPLAWRLIEKAGPDRVKTLDMKNSRLFISTLNRVDRF